VAAKARGLLGGRPEKDGVKDIELMKALIEGGTPKTWQKDGVFLELPSIAIWNVSDLIT